MTSDLENGLLVGLLVGEGHFGGDGRQAQVTLRMHVRHEAMFRWIERTFPGGKLYGPYDHGGRHYFQWMARGPYLHDELVPLLNRLITRQFDEYSFGRFREMIERYGLMSDLVDDRSVVADSEESGTTSDLKRNSAVTDNLDALFGRLRGGDERSGNEQESPAADG